MEFIFPSATSYIQALRITDEFKREGVKANPIDKVISLDDIQFVDAYIKRLDEDDILYKVMQTS